AGLVGWGRVGGERGEWLVGADHEIEGVERHAAVAARSDEPGHDLGDAQAGGTQQRRRVPRAPGEVDPTRGVRFRDDGREDVRGPAVAPAGGLYLGAHGVVGDREVAPSRLETWADERRDVVGDVPDALLPARQVGRPRMRGGGG